ncbi:uncharacterized protein LOC129249093 isoform X1 [Anastrepha obliqua]|uniref:uncharacterized protein LOC129249093 isoform X1 n=1 Tax=Anastrepha obliqua TaxID=95512 RepID=UPI002409C0AA|nr:uncharacterized protein LOC129249093 isoform X1 [Anastrepha obliqua]
MTTDFNLNRLNLPNMVGRQLNGVSLPVNRYFSPLVISDKRKALEHKQPMHMAMSTSVTDIVAAVHNNLRSTTEQPKIAEEKPKLVKETVAEFSIENLPVVETKNDAKSNIKKLRFPLNETSIPQIKAARANKQQQRMRRSILKPSDYDDLVSQRRILEVREQKRILEDMLIQHQRLQRDRQSIEMEIQAMREHLSDLRNKLDVSLKKLTTKPIGYNQVLLKPKMVSRPQKFNPMYSRKLPMVPAKPPALHSILKVSNAMPKSTNQVGKPAKSPAPKRRSPTRKSPIFSKNTKR